MRPTLVTRFRKAETKLDSLEGSAGSRVPRREWLPELITTCLAFFEEGHGVEQVAPWCGLRARRHAAPGSNVVALWRLVKRQLEIAPLRARVPS